MHSDSPSDDEYDSDEPAPLVLDLDILGRRASHAVSRTFTHWRKLTKGRYHEVFVLYFTSDDTPRPTTDGQHTDNQWTCIARVSRQPEMLEKLQSEVETMEYIRSHTTIPVPEIYAHDFRINNNVGAQYILMERMPGRHLYQLWDSLSLDYKKIAISEIARVVSQLQQQRFDSIGCLSMTHIGPLIYRMGGPEGDERIYKGGPFNSTLDYLLHFLNAQTDGSEVFSEVEAVLRSHFEMYGSDIALLEPFRLTHADFDAQNILFTGGISNDPELDDGGPPRLSGVIDWEHAYTGPLYFLYEYPIFIQDSDDNKEAYADNAILRRVFKRALLQYAPDGCMVWIELQTAMKKNYTLNWFHRVFVRMAGGLGLPSLKMLAAEYVGNVRHGTGKAYEGRFDYVSDDEGSNEAVEVRTDDR